MNLIEKIKALEIEAGKLKEEAQSVFSDEFLDTINREELSPLTCELLEYVERINYVKMSDAEGSEAYYTVLTLNDPESTEEVTVSILTQTYTEDWPEFHSFDDTHLELFLNSNPNDLIDLFEEYAGLMIKGNYTEEDMETLWNEFDGIFEKARKEYGSTFLFIREEA